MKLKLMTYNIAATRDFGKGTGKPFEYSVEKYAQMTKEQNPDICGLNEVDYMLVRSGRIKTTRALGALLGYEDAFAPAVTWLFGGKPGNYGNGFLSKHHIKDVRICPIPDPVTRDEDVYYETRVILNALVDFEGTDVDVFVSHFGLAKAERANAVKILAELIKDSSHPVIVMGDFNAQPDDPVLDPIRGLLSDTFDVYPDKGAITYPTNPEFGPDQKIDYIFVSKEFRTESVEIIDRQLSDHKAYIANVELTV